MNTTAGSYALIGSEVARDAGVVERQRKAGAVMLGKASLSEWYRIRSINGVPNGWCARSGQGVNPYVPSGSPCRSSSGYVISVAANMVAVSLGTETHSFIICPSDHNSVVGLKPTIGLTSRAAVIPYAPRWDTIGPICRTVEDAVYVLDVIAGFDPRDDEATREGFKFIPEGGYFFWISEACISTGQRNCVVPRSQSHSIELSSESTSLNPLLFTFEGPCHSPTKSPSERDLGGPRMRVDRRGSKGHFCAFPLCVMQTGVFGPAIEQNPAAGFHSTVNAAISCWEFWRLRTSSRSMKDEEEDGRRKRGFVPSEREKHWTAIDVREREIAKRENEGLKGKRLGVVRSPFVDKLHDSAIAASFEDHLSTLRKRGAIVVDNLHIANIDEILDPHRSGELMVMATDFKISINAYLKELITSPVRSLTCIITFNQNNPELEKLAEYGQQTFIEAEESTGIGEKEIQVTSGSRASPILAIGGYPAITAPAGYDSDGMPFGIFFGGLRGTELKLVEIAYGFEQATKVQRPPRFSTLELSEKASV
ncbi:hypothetical protein TEA_009484 [Camellia sinensis var. sinensis]|uniref:Amidase domain-containing protein n=1 Tax=Camellia sinensis var. sinensis TaxID=542762 RepID=A0A4V3WIU7_CAMSN|nr:hypothetical protein TEA_009484 [Camellia sinensis var. sinensis]